VPLTVTAVAAGGAAVGFGMAAGGAAGVAAGGAGGAVGAAVGIGVGLGVAAESGAAGDPAVGFGVGLCVAAGPAVGFGVGLCVAAGDGARVALGEPAGRAAAAAGDAGPVPSCAIGAGAVDVTTCGTPEAAAAWRAVPSGPALPTGLAPVAAALHAASAKAQASPSVTVVIRVRSMNMAVSAMSPARDGWTPARWGRVWTVPDPAARCGRAGEEAAGLRQKSMVFWTTTSCAWMVVPLRGPVTSTPPPTAMNWLGTMCPSRLTIEVPGLITTV